MFISAVYIPMLLYVYYYGMMDHSGIKMDALWPWQPPSIFHDNHHKYLFFNRAIFCLLIKGPNKETFIKRKEQSKKDNPEKLVTCSTQDEEKKNKKNTICDGHHYT
jgi:hypothetical protein